MGWHHHLVFYFSNKTYTTLAISGLPELQAFRECLLQSVSLLQAKSPAIVQAVQATPNKMIGYIPGI